jgi:hypothetical protein
MMPVVSNRLYAMCVYCFSSFVLNSLFCSLITSIQVCCAQNKPVACLVVACRPAGLFFLIEAADLLSLLLEMKIDARITYAYS